MKLFFEMLVVATLVYGFASIAGLITSGAPDLSELSDLCRRHEISVTRLHAAPGKGN